MKGLVFKVAIILLDVFLLLFAIHIYITNPYDDNEVYCMVNRITGLHCATCGATRAVYSIMHFDFVSALYYNGLITLTLPITILALVKINLQILFDKTIINLNGYGIKLYYVLVVVIVLFIVIRNLTTIIY